MCKSKIQEKMLLYWKMVPYKVMDKHKLVGRLELVVQRLFRSELKGLWLLTQGQVYDECNLLNEKLVMRLVLNV